jgi:hypothetical protein
MGIPSEALISDEMIMAIPPRLRNGCETYQTITQ